MKPQAVDLEADIRRAVYDEAVIVRSGRRFRYKTIDGTFAAGRYGSKDAAAASIFTVFGADWKNNPLSLPK